MNYNLQTPSDKRTDILQVDWNEKGLPYIKDAIIFQLNHTSEMTGRHYVATARALEALGEIAHRQEPVYMELGNPDRIRYPQSSSDEFYKRMHVIEASNHCAAMYNLRIVYEDDAGKPLLPGPCLVADVHSLDLPTGEAFRNALEAGQDGFRASLRGLVEPTTVFNFRGEERLSIHRIVTFDIILLEEDEARELETQQKKEARKVADAEDMSSVAAAE